MSFLFEPPAELAAWIAVADAATAPGQGPQHPIDEVLAEHQLIRAVFDATEREARRLEAGAAPRTSTWSDVVELLGNYVHLCHRRKEDQAFFPRLLDAGLLTDAEAALDTRREHHKAEQLTVELVDAVSEGDWAKVPETVDRYLALLRPHLAREERAFLGPLRANLPPELVEVLRRDFAEIEGLALGRRSRRHFLEVARRLCTAAEGAAD